MKKFIFLADVILRFLFMVAPKTEPKEMEEEIQKLF